MGHAHRRRRAVLAALTAFGVVVAALAVGLALQRSPTADDDGSCTSTSRSGTRVPTSTPTTSGPAPTAVSSTAPTAPTGPAPTAGPAPAPRATPAPPAPAPEPEPEPEPEPPPLAGPGPAGYAAEIMAAMNADRGANGAPALAWSGGLAGYAQGWANWMAANTTLSHQNIYPLLDLGFTVAGENIATGPPSMLAGQCEAAWMGSGSHRDNILNSEYSVAGVGVASSASGQLYVAVDFGG